MSQLRRGLLLSALLLLGTSALRATDASSPVHHIVLFQYKEGTSPQEVAAISRAFAELPEKVPGVIGFQYGRDNSPEGLQDGYTHAYVVTFENQAALDAYGPHEAHQAFVAFAIPKVEKVFAFDFAVDEPAPPAEPGRTHHLVFFKYKEDTSEERLAEIMTAFRALEGQIPGILSIQTGENRTSERSDQGFAHGYWLTFTNERARDDYLPHPAHGAFVDVLRPSLVQPLVIDFTTRPSSRSLFITAGLEPYRVYQRGEDDTADLEFAGVCAADGSIEARLRSGRRTVDGFDWREVGASVGGEFSASLEGVPVGGPYTVEVRRRDALGNVASHTEVADVLVGDIWLLAGQSNMEGVGDLDDVEEPHPLVHCFTMGRRWELAKEPLHWLIDSPDPVHSGRYLQGAKDESERRARRAAQRESRTKGAGLGLPFAKVMVLETGVPVGLIAAAHGGTSMRQWDPEQRDRGGESLYGSMLRQVRDAGGAVRGVLWYQGESDANPGAVPEFAERFEGLVGAMREDLGNDELPFYYVQIGRFVRPGDSAPWDAIQELQRQAEAEIDGVGMVSVIDLPLDDLIHVGTEGLARTGARLATLALRDLFGAEVQPGPRPVAVEAEEGGRRIRVRFSGVNGSLLPDDAIPGFSIADADGADVATIFNARVDPESSDTVILELQNPVPEGAVLWYGRGLDPVCRLVDEEDLAAPVFGPHAIER